MAGEVFLKGGMGARSDRVYYLNGGAGPELKPPPPPPAIGLEGGAGGATGGGRNVRHLASYLNGVTCCAVPWWRHRV